MNFIQSEILNFLESQIYWNIEKGVWNNGEKWFNVFSSVNEIFLILVCHMENTYNLLSSHILNIYSGATKKYSYLSYILMFALRIMYSSIFLYNFYFFEDEVHAKWIKLGFKKEQTTILILFYYKNEYLLKKCSLDCFFDTRFMFNYRFEEVLWVFKTIFWINWVFRGLIYKEHHVKL